MDFVPKKIVIKLEYCNILGYQKKAKFKTAGVSRVGLSNIYSNKNQFIQLLLYSKNKTYRLSI